MYIGICRPFGLALATLRLGRAYDQRCARRLPVFGAAGCTAGSVPALGVTGMNAFTVGTGSGGGSC